MEITESAEKIKESGISYSMILIHKRHVDLMNYVLRESTETPDRQLEFFQNIFARKRSAKGVEETKCHAYL